MRTNYARLFPPRMIMAVSLFAFSQQAFSQAPDSLSAVPGGALQFQLFGGLGVSYIDNLGANSFVRIGVSGSYSHSHNSGDGNQFSGRSSSDNYSSQGSSNNQPEHKGTSYSIAISGLYFRKLMSDANAVLYCGAGPSASYSWAKASSSNSVVTAAVPTPQLDTDTDDYTDRTVGIGPVATLGVRADLFRHVSVSAEMSFSALYEWTSDTQASRSRTKFYNGYATSSETSSNSNLSGWAVSLSGIVIGVVIEL